jgi:hypothetical protein
MSAPVRLVRPTFHLPSRTVCGKRHHVQYAAALEAKVGTVANRADTVI